MTEIQLLLEDYTALLWVGVLPDEHSTPQRVRVNVSAWLKKPPGHDILSKTYDYTKIIKEIDALAAKHVDLLETFAERLAKKLLADKKIIAVEIELMKLDILENGRVGVRYRLSK